MLNPCRKSSFGVVIKCCVFLFLSLFVLHALAQEKTVDGIVFDKDSKERIAKVNVVNIRTKQAVYNNLQAEFHINAQPGDQLIFSKQNYFSDTVTVKDMSSIAVYLKPSSIMLKQVNIHDTLQTPEKRLEATKRDYSKIYGSLGDRDILSVSPYGGAGISIDAIWNMLSRSGRNAEHLKTIIERDYHENLIDYRFNKTLVASVTGLKEPQLSDFMQRYRPGYYQVITASDYDFILSIKANYRRFMRNPRAYKLPSLKKPLYYKPDEE
jgi:co-chaperonin GroES (HSP10)